MGTERLMRITDKTHLINENTFKLTSFFSFFFFFEVGTEKSKALKFSKIVGLFTVVEQSNWNSIIFMYNL